MLHGKKAGRTGYLKEKYRDMIFYILLIAFPVVQFSFFWIGVNFNSILMTFQKIEIDVTAGQYVTRWTLETISNAFQNMFGDPAMLQIMWTSVLSWFLILIIGTPLGLIFSFYIYKEFPLSKAFRVILFLPSILSAIVMATIYNFFVERAIPAAASEWFGIQGVSGLFTNTQTRYGTLIFFNIWVGFGTSVLMYSNGMSTISQEIVDAAHIDGANGLREFWYISLPLVWQTFSTFVIVGVAGLFTNEINLYAFYGGSAPLNMQTYGYYLYMRTVAAAGNSAEYPPIAALGFIMTLIAVPLTLLVRRLLEKFGPKED